MMTNETSLFLILKTNLIKNLIFHYSCNNYIQNPQTKNNKDCLRLYSQKSVVHYYTN